MTAVRFLAQVRFVITCTARGRTSSSSGSWIECSDGKRIDGRLAHVPHGTAEYDAVRAGRDRKYSGNEEGRAAAETAAHGTVVKVGEVLTGRSQRAEPGDRLYRVDPR